MPKNPIKQKDELDRFYTKPEVAEICYQRVLPHLTPNDFLIEPAAGSGSFYEFMRPPKIGYDLAPRHSEIIQGDWFNQTIPKNSVIIGNPPFGSRNKLSKAFILYSIPHSRSICFILPMTFRKESTQKVFPDDWVLVDDYTLPKNSFLLDGCDYHVPSTFQIWIKNSNLPNLRQSHQIKHQTTDFIFTRTNATHFIFGAAPNKIIKPENVHSNNRGYYIQSNIEDIEKVFKEIPWKDYALSSVNGNVSWYSKQEIVNVYVKEMTEKINDLKQF